MPDQCNLTESRPPDAAPANPIPEKIASLDKEANQTGSLVAELCERLLPLFASDPRENKDIDHQLHRELEELSLIENDLNNVSWKLKRTKDLLEAMMGELRL